MRSVRATLACALVLAGVASISTMPVKKEHKNNDVPNAAAAPKTAITIPCAVPFTQCTVYARMCTYMYSYMYRTCSLAGGPLRPMHRGRGYCIALLAYALYCLLSDSVLREED